MHSFDDLTFFTDSIEHSPVFTGQVRFSDKKKDLPGDIDSAIKALFELYDPMKKGAFAAL